MAEDRQAEKRINLAALRKQDQNAEKILATASSVAHYKFDASTERWEKTEFEGSLFVYNRSGGKFQIAFLIMNRLNKDNLIVEIKPGMEFKLQEPFLLCRTVSDIIGIWFYDIKECSRISSLLSRISSVVENEQELSNLIDEISPETEQKEIQKSDVLKLFTKAKEEYDKKEKKDNITKSASITKFSSDEQRDPVIRKRSNSIPDGLEETKTSRATLPSNQNVQDSQVLMRMLQQNKNAQRKPRSRTLSYGEYNSDARRDLTVLTKQFNAAKSGDSLLSQSSTVVGGMSALPSGNYGKPNIIDVAMLEANVLLNPSSSTDNSEGQQQHHVVSKSESRTPKRAEKSEMPSLWNTKDSPMPVNSVTSLTSPANIATSINSATSKGHIVGMGRGRGLASILNITEKRPDDAAQTSTTSTLSNRMQPADTSKKTTPKKDTGLAMKFPDPPPSGLLSSLMSPMQFKAAQKTLPRPCDVNSSAELPQLSKQQFQEAILDLIQNDDTFVERLHSSYTNMIGRSNR